MIDSIRIFVPQPVKERNLSTLVNAKEITNRDTGESKTVGNLKNLQIRCSQGSTIIYGSIPKFFLGSSLFTLALKETRLAFESISDLLGIGVLAGRFTRIDLGINLNLSQSVSNYFSIFGNVRHLKKSVYFEWPGLLYGNKSRVIAIYDKIAEINHTRKEQIPKGWGSKNILRFELRLKKKPCHYLGGDPSVAGLVKPGGYEGYANLVRRTFGTISRVSRKRIHVSYLCVRKFTSSLAAAGLKKYGSDRVTQEISSAVKTGKISQIQGTRLKSKVSELESGLPSVGINHLYEEMFSLVKKETQSHKGKV